MRTTQALSNCFIGQPNLCSNLGNRQFAVEIQSPQLFQWNTGFGPSLMRSKSVSSSVKPTSNTGARYSNLIADFFDYKPLVEIKARELFSGDVDFSEFFTTIKRKVVRPVRDFAVHDIGTSLGLFIAGDIITSNTETRLDYEVDADGAILIERLDPLEMDYDPAAVKRNLDDAAWIARTRYYER